jgi:hypothetical protein
MQSGSTCALAQQDLIPASSFRDFVCRVCRVLSWFRSEFPILASGSRALLGLIAALFVAATLNAQSVTVTNVQSNHYHYVYPIGNQDCPAGYQIPAGQYPSTDHLERGHAIHHVDPSNVANDYWVYWAHFDNSSYSLAEAAVFKSTAECGPYILQTYISSQYNVDGGGYGFQPGGWQSRDENVFQDSDQKYNPDGTVASYASAYFVTASNSMHSVANPVTGSTCSYANDSMAIFKMTPDYMGIDTTTNPATNGANWVFVCDQREAPVVMKNGSSYFLITSQAAGWFPSQGGYGVSSNMLTGWTPNPLPLGNASTFGGQTSDGFTIHGTQTNTYILTFDHLGGNTLRDTGEMWLPVILDGDAKTATLNWSPSFTVDSTTGVLTLPQMTNVALNAAVSATVASTANSCSTGSNGVTTCSGPTSYAVDGSYLTRWSTPGGTAFPASLTVDLGSIQPVQEIDLTWYMIKGSEPYYTYTIGYSNDGITWTTLDYTSNVTYGFTTNPVNFSARYIKLTETGFACQTGCTFYTPGLWDMTVVQAPPSENLTPTVTVTPSVSSVDYSTPFTVAVNVSGPSGSPIPTGYITLTGGGYTSPTYGLVNGANSFTIPAGAMAAGEDTLSVTYTPDPTSAPIYTLTPTTGASATPVAVGSIPATPAGLKVTPSASGTLILKWTSSPSTVTYNINRSVNGASYSALATSSTSGYTDSGLTNNTIIYCYKVSATNAWGTSPDSAGVCATPQQTAVSVPNYSFELPVTSSYIYNPSASTASWTFTPSGTRVGSGVATNGSGFTSGNNAAPDGKQVAFVQGTASVTQSLSGFTPGTTYTVTVAASQRQNKSGGQAGNTFDVRVNGATIASFDPSQSSKAYADFTAQFTATNSTNTIAFVGTNLLATSTYPDNTVFLDNVRISAVTGTGALQIAALPANTTYATATAQLTATATYSGTKPPSSGLVFQVNGGDQMPGACTFSGTTQSCTVSYPTDTLAAGNYPVLVTYQGDSTFAPSSASATLTVNPAATTTLVTGGTFTYDGNAHPAAVLMTGAGGLSLSATPVYSGSCSAPPISVPQGSSCTVSYSYAGDSNYLPSNGSASILITPAPTMVTNMTVTPSLQQYSDLISISAGVGSSPGIGGTLSFFLNYGTATQQQLGATQMPGPNGTATLSNIALLEGTVGAMAPGSRTITGVFTPTDSVNFTGGAANVALAISQEDSNLTYSGLYLLYTSSPTTHSVTVPLTFTVQDSNAVPASMSIYDLSPGDIRNARYKILVDGVATPSCGNLQPALVTSDARVGTIGCSYTFSIPNNAVAITPTITVAADSGSYYAARAGDSGFTISVNLPSQTHFITGGGYIVNVASAGSYAGDAGAKTNFGFNVKYNGSGTNLQGHVNIIVRSHGQLYQIKSNSIGSLGVTDTDEGGYGSFLSKATIQDITDPANPISIEGNDSLTITFHDKGSPGTNDTISISVYNGGTLRFAADWDGTQSVEQSPSGGNLAVQ